jgi:hypothetical protein
MPGLSLRVYTDLYMQQHRQLKVHLYVQFQNEFLKSIISLNLMHLQSPSVKKYNAKLHCEIGRVNESLNN